MKSKKIIVLGGCGYIGSKLVNQLLNRNYKVMVIDTMWFGDYLKKNKNLTKKKLDIRDIQKTSFRGYDTIIHLANIANDPSVDLNTSLSWEVNVLATNEILKKAINEKVKKFIFSSSGSVYGIREEKQVVETTSMTPISIYNKTKMIAERVIQSYSKKIRAYIVRPATVCGTSPRMRFDITVNALSKDAVIKKKINVDGGSQIRPNIHIDDIVNIFTSMCEDKIKPGVYNAGFENLKIIDIARLVAKNINSKIKINKKFDLRSYRLSSKKLIKSGFKPKKTINDAITEIEDLLLNKKYKISEQNYTVRWMKKRKIK